MHAGSRIIAAFVGALALAGAASLAHADPAANLSAATATHNTPPDSKPTNQPVRRTILLNQKGRWSVRLDMNQPVGRDVQLNDVQAGAFFRLTPTLRVGGAVALGDGALPTDRTNLPQVQAQSPRLKLETNFKF
jgi:hypothetical protein